MMFPIIKQQMIVQSRVFFNLTNATTRALCSASTVKAPPEHYDIIIGGGGLVGTALAAALAKKRVMSEKRVLLLEAADEFKGFNSKSEYGNRVSAINNNSIELFKSIGAWDRMVGARVKPVKQMQIWDASSDALIQFQHEQFSEDVAFVVENDLMLDAVYAEIRGAGENSNVEIRNNSRIDWVRLPEQTGSGRSEIGLTSGETYTCDLLVGADGANSLVRKQMGVDVFSINYERMGLVATVKLSEGIDNSMAWQRFIPTGPVALLPLNDDISSLVWSTNGPHAKQLAAMSEQDFVAALNEAFSKDFPKSDLVVKGLNALNSLMGRFTRFGSFYQYPPRIAGIVENSRATFPLGFLHASSYICAGAALIGDAAHRIHPLAGQGVNLGFSDVRFLVDSLSEAAYAGSKMGDKKYLVKYEQKSLTKNVPILIGVHGLQTLYSTTFSPIVLLRSLGLQLTHNIPKIKNVFMKRAIS